MTRRAAALVLALGLLLVGLGGCHRYRFVTDAEAGDRRITQWQHNWLFGAISDQPFDLEQACGSGSVPAEFGSYISFPNALLTLGTISLYAPRTAYAECAR